MSNPRSSGFTLIEMIVALLLSSVVLIGLIDISANMVERQFEGIRSGRVDSQTLLSLQQMYLEIEGATHLASPIVGGGSFTIAGCNNYYASTGQINTTYPITWFDYCVENGGGQGPYNLIRYSGVGCSPTCGGPNAETLVYQDVWLNTQYPNPFALNQYSDGVDINFYVGNPNPTSAQPTPVDYPIDTSIIPNDGHFQ